jgi:DNA-binding transcriptional LysR family regulator
MTAAFISLLSECSFGGKFSGAACRAEAINLHDHRDRLETLMSKLMQYAAFVATVEHGTLAKAARQLNLSPSAISKQLTGLEQTLRVTLLDRSNRTLQPTDAGRAFHQRCKAILAEIRTAEAEALASRDALAGRIRLTLPVHLSRSSVPMLIAEFATLHPRLRFDLHMTDEVEDLIETGRDFAFRVGKLKDTRLRAVRLFEARPVFCAAPAYLERCGRPQRLADLQEHPRMLLSTLNLSAATQRLFGGKQRVPLDTEQHHSTNDVNTLYQMVSSGLCIGALLDHMVSADIAAGRLVNLFPELELPGKPLYLQYARRGELPQRLQLFKDFIKLRLAVPRS